MMNSIIFKDNLSALQERGLILINLNPGGLKHRVVTLELSQYLLEDRGKPREPVSRWPVAGSSGCTLTSSDQSGKQKIVIILEATISFN
jgi:hypothetical protein